MNSIETDCVVELQYTLRDDDGELLDSAGADDPFHYLHGSGQIVPGLESALAGLKVGDKKKVSIPPAEGYGEYDPQLALTVGKAQFPEGVNLEVGMQFESTTPEGYDAVFSVEKIEDDKVHIDGNHPLAGATLHFEVEVMGIRKATQEELSHGHAHGPGGHSH
jgi:FKBP-type peptidyl-prolyl cis-trans isomerase SlyD